MVKMYTFPNEMNKKNHDDNDNGNRCLYYCALQEKA